MNNKSLYLSAQLIMKAGQKLWSREETIIAYNLYCQLPFGQLHQNNKEIIKLSNLLGRTPGAVSYKLVNLASLDPTLRARGIKGATNSSKMDKTVWKEFYGNWEELLFESEKLRAQLEGKSVLEKAETSEPYLPKQGLTREQIIRVRVNQSIFRRIVLSSYNSTCCITGIQNPLLLVAGHIKPWSVDEAARLNPSNGICINPLHDKAFENGLITISIDYKIVVSPKALREMDTQSFATFFAPYVDKEIRLPSKFLPDPVFLEYHNRERFLK